MVDVVQSVPARYAFVIGTGLVKAQEGMFKFSTLNSDWGPEYILHLAVKSPEREKEYQEDGSRMR